MQLLPVGNLKGRDESVAKLSGLVEEWLTVGLHQTPVDRATNSTLVGLAVVSHEDVRGATGDRLGRADFTKVRAMTLSG